MRISGLVFVIFAVVMLFTGLTPPAQAVEEGQLQKKDGRWEYLPSEDPGLKYLLLKGIITQDEYDKGLEGLGNQGTDRETELQYRRQQRVEHPSRLEIPAQDAAAHPGPL